MQSNAGLYDIISLLIPTVSRLFSGIFVIDYLVKKIPQNVLIYSTDVPQTQDILMTKTI